MAPSIPLLYILFTLGALPKFSSCISDLDVGVHFVEEPKDVIGVTGKSLSLSCKPGRTNKQRNLEIKWYHNNRLMDLTNDRRRKIFPNGTLYFSKLVHKRSGHSDQGEYRCVIAKENGSLSSRPGFLRISVLPKSFSRHPEQQIVEIGSNVRFSCEIDSFSELEIEWGKNDQKLPQNDSKYLIVSGPGVRGSVLYIFNAVTEDSGSYRCIARNVLLNKQRLSSGGLLTVSPRVVESNLNENSFTFLSAQELSSPSSFVGVKEIKEGGNITLDCVANGSPTPVLIWSYLPYGKNSSQSVLNQTNPGYNILKIHNITRHQAGWYKCAAMGFPRREITTEVKVLTPPVIQEKTKSIVFRASKTVRFRCAASGNPLPQIYWLKDGDLFNFTGRIKHCTSENESQQLRLSQLILSSTVTSDAGIYQCMANNSVGWAWAAGRLLLNATRPAPEAPEKVACETLSSSEIKLTWAVPNTTDNILAFSVHYHRSENGEEVQIVLAADSCSTQIDKLLPFTNYTFYVRLYVASASDFSRKIICQTGEEVPIEAPKMMLQITGPNSVNLSWLPLSKEKARGIVNQYKVQWRIMGSPSSRVEEVSGDVLDYTIRGLIPGKYYEVRVLAATSKGWPDEDFPWQTFQIPLNYNESFPSAPEVELRAINSSSIEVSWIIHSKKTQFKGFKIFYRKQNSSLLGPIEVSSEVKKYIITELDPDTWYEVMVRGYTNLNDGETGSNSIYTLSKDGLSNHLPPNFPSILEPPASLEADPVSPVAINLSWSSPQVSSGSNRISYYTVCFNAVRTSRNKNSSSTCVKSLETKMLIVGLDPFTLYEFKIKSHDKNNKHSAFGQTVECHTLEDVPGPVVDVNWKALNKTTVLVSWKKPRQCNGILKNYTISYSQDPKLALNFWNVKVVSANDSKTHLTDLTPNVKYYLLVRASTSAGLGSYGTPKQFLIPSPTGTSRDELSSKTSKTKHTDHYVGIMVGLGIGFCCIILCTTCILCRRRCLKSHINQEFEVSSARFTNGNDCRRDNNREAVREPLEAELFTFLSAPSNRFTPMEVTVQHLDSKGRCPNVSANGMTTSLLSGERTQNDRGRANIYITENPRYNPNCSKSPLLKPKTSSKSLSCDSESPERFTFFENRRCSSRSLREGKGFSLEVKTPAGLYNNNNFEPENHTVTKKISAGDRAAKFSCQIGEDDIVQSSIERNELDGLSEDEQWSDLNSVLKNPDFRFSNTNSEKFTKRKNGFALPGPFRSTVIEQSLVKENGTIKGYEDGRKQPINGICEPSQVSLRVLSKEISLKS